MDNVISLIGVDHESLFCTPSGISIYMFVSQNKLYSLVNTDTKRKMICKYKTALDIL